MCEGTSYSCEIDLQDHQDIVEIPSAPVPPEVHCNIPNTAKVICFDLETTSLARDSHITQIAAVNGESHWTSYVIPKLPISSQASEVTGLTMRNGRMFHQGKVVESSTISTALDGFLEFLKAAEKETQGMVPTDYRTNKHFLSDNQIASCLDIITRPILQLDSVMTPTTRDQAGLLLC
ncbi:unnamed protein product [Mytilus edulis]|uniref:Exonuclease domain-containing protein n=1 Tax=Mytilus edulis TaxID=6550 RepID=A0A8S3RNV8_MYTED|nr:unnamed protein product [Mytilus edulis]